MVDLQNGETFALEVISGRGEEELVPQSQRLGTASDARLDVVPFDPFSQPAKVTIAVERIRSHGPAIELK